jgi:hypothetical protein
MGFTVSVGETVTEDLGRASYEHESPPTDGTITIFRKATEKIDAN